jgi:hypothetical protein
MDFDPRDHDSRDRDGREGHDPREAFMRDLELPRGKDREIVRDWDHEYNLRGTETRTLSTVGAFRVVPAHGSAAARSGFTCDGGGSARTGGGGRSPDPHLAEELFR